MLVNNELGPARRRLVSLCFIQAGRVPGPIQSAGYLGLALCVGTGTLPAANKSFNGNKPRASPNTHECKLLDKATPNNGNKYELSSKHYMKV